MADPKATKRAAREAALKAMNAIADPQGLEPVSMRASNADIEAFYKGLCAKLSPDDVAEVSSARAKYIENGGTADLPCDLLAKLSAPDSSQRDEDGHVPQHRMVD